MPESGTRGSLRDIWGLRTVFVTGKGGVGKTSVAAAIAELRRRRGDRVLLVEIDHIRPSMAPVFGVESAHEPQKTPRDGLWICNLNWNTALRDYLSETLPTATLAGALLSIPAARTFLEAMPGAPEMVMLRALLRLHSEGKGRFDVQVVDLPASGHATALFSVAETVEKLFSRGNLSAIKSQAEEIQETFSGESTGLVFVAIPEEMSVTESIETRRHIERLGFPRQRGIVVNQFPLEAPEPSLDPLLQKLEQSELDEGLREALDAARSALWQRNRAEGAEARLLEGGFLDVEELPRLALEGLDLVDALADTLERDLGGLDDSTERSSKEPA